MRTSAKALINYTSVNQFSSANQWSVRSGDQNYLYFQLIDLDNQNLRYMAGIGVSNQPTGIIVTFPSIDDSKIVNLTAQQETDDKSIWKVFINETQQPYSGNVLFAFTEGSVTRRFSVINMLNVEPLDNGAC